MCGIIGYIGPKQSTGLLIGGLKRLEYRGYDSAGVAVIEPGKDGSPQELKVLRCRGKLGELENLVAREPPQGHVGIGHTRWATHGRPSDENAHPHCYKGVAVVHNGIIENYLEIKQALAARGHEFQSETDTEIIAHLIWEELQRDPLPAPSAQTPRSVAQRNDRLLQATRRALHRIEGAYAIVVLSIETPEEIVCAKNASPLVLGLGQGENFIASDVPAVLEHTRRVVFLEEGDIAQVRSDGVRIIDLDGNERTTTQRPPRTITWSLVAAEKAGFKHFMLKEIHEQPRAVTDTLRGRLVHQPPDALLDGINLGQPGLDVSSKVRRILLLACGTSYHAALVGKYMIERLSRLPVEVDLASEFRYRDPVVLPGDLAVSVSQSGETADTLAAVKEARQRGAQTLSIANVVDSSIARAAHHALYTHAGPEIGVASTKAFTTQLAALFLLAVHLGRRTGALGEAAAAELLHELLSVPAKIGEAVETAVQVQALARRFAHAQDVLYLGRGPQFPIALEGALKLKEISYIHAEGYAAGEMKHGPIALIDEGTPVIVLAPEEHGYEKVLSNLSEVKARGGQVIAIATRGDAALRRLADEVIEVPRAPSLLLPLITVVPLQLFAYHVADIKGTDVDQPRNLAKSVTVE